MPDHCGEVRSRHAEELQLLLNESVRASEDDRYDAQQFAAIIGVALALIIALGTLFYQTYPKEYCKPEAHLKPPPEINCQQPNSKLTAIPAWIYIGAPMIPILLISYAMVISFTMTLRSYYARTLERKIHKLTQQSSDNFLIPSWAHLQLEVTGQSRSGLWIRPLWFLMYFIILAMLAGCLVFSFGMIPEHLRFSLGIIPEQMRDYRCIAIVVDVLALVPCATVIANALSGHRLWKRALAAFPKRITRTDAGFPGRRFFPPQQPGERSLISFILLPRIQEEVLKAFFIPISFVIGWLLCQVRLTWPPGETIGRVVIFWIVFEGLVYQGRYLWNDLKDRCIDSTRALWKQRFPPSLIKNSSAIAICAFALLVRAVIAVAIVFLAFPRWELAWPFFFLVVVLITAAGYEYIRSWCNRAEADRQNAMTDALKAKFKRARNRRTVALLLVVGLGYGLRAVVGVWLAGVIHKEPLALFAGASLFGSTFVALAWALESTRGSQAELGGKAHLIMLQDIIRTQTKGILINVRERVLAGRQSLQAPWSYFAILATILLVVFTLRYLPNSRIIFLGIVVVSSVAIYAVFAPVKQTGLLTGLVFIGIIATLVFALSGELSIRLAHAFTSAVVICLPLLVTWKFRSMRYDDLQRCMDRFVRCIEIKGVYCYWRLYLLYKRLVRER